MAEYCYPHKLRAHAQLAFSQQWRWHFHRREPESGIAENPGKAWGVVATDINNDGRMDLFVANDAVANFLFANRGGGHFEEIGLTRRRRLRAEGRVRSGMGVDSADYNQDGWMDLIVTNLDHEMYSLYQNKHDETFDDKSPRHGIGSRHPTNERLGHEILRLRQRRQSRPIHRQRPSR